MSTISQANLQSIKRILIIKLRAIGDVILATPVIENLRRAFPGAEIDFLTEKPCYPIVREHPGLNEVLVFDRRYIENLSYVKALFENLRFFKLLRDKNYELVFDLFGNPRSALFARVTGARYRVGFAFRGRKLAYNIVVPPRGNRVHEVQFNLDALAHIGIPLYTRQLYIAINDVNDAYAEKYWWEKNLQGQTVIGMNTSGGWYTKRWPLEKFADLADRLVEALKAKILLLWGPGELSDVQKVKSMMRNPALIAPQSDLSQLAAILKRLNLLVSNDSGPLHLAAAVGTRVAGIYGPTRPDLQGPWGNGHTIIRKDNLDCLGCNGVTCKIQTHDCMQQLDVQTVFQAVLRALN